MAFVNRTKNDLGYITETKTLPASATTEYSSVISAIKVRSKTESNGQYVSFAFKASAVSGTNLDIALYGALTKTGTKFLLKDAVVADITDATKAVGTLDMQAYPAPYYFLAWTADANESANTITVEVFGDLGSGGE